MSLLVIQHKNYKNRHHISIDLYDGTLGRGQTILKEKNGL